MQGLAAGSGLDSGQNNGLYSSSPHRSPRCTRWGSCSGLRCETGLPATSSQTPAQSRYRELSSALGAVHSYLATVRDQRWGMRR